MNVDFLADHITIPLQVMLDAAPTGMMLVDEGGLILMANQLLAMQFGYVNTELLGQPVEVLIPDRLRTNHPEHFKRFFAAPESRPMGLGRELYGKRKDGTEFTVEIGLNPLRHEDATYVLASLVDITERKKREAQHISTISQRLLLATQSSEIGIWEWDIVQNKLTWDAQMYALYGLPKESQDEPYSTWVNALHPDDRQSAEEALQLARQGKQDFHVQFRVIWPDQSIHWIQGAGSVEQDPTGLSFRMVGVNWDITHEKNSEQVLRESEQLQMAIMDSLSAHICVVDHLGKIVSYNKQWNLFGKENSILGDSGGIGTNYLNICERASKDGVEEAQEVASGLWGIIGGEKDEFSLEYACHSPTENRWFICRMSVLLDSSPRKVVIAHENITPIKAAEQVLIQYNQELEKSNEELDDFAYIASHDLKEPLRGIFNYATILLEDHAPSMNDDAKVRCETLCRLSRRMEELLDGLLYYSRTGRTELSIKMTDLDQVLGTVFETLDISLKESGVLLNVPQIFPEVICDSVRVGEIFRNLIANAMKYNDKAEKWIEVGFCDGASTGSVSNEHPTGIPVYYVKDNGVGIREKHFKNIFRIFKRLHGRDKFGGGTGAGLTITKKLVERHGGQIWIESTVGEGTTFFFTLQRSERHGHTKSTHSTG